MLHRNPLGLLGSGTDNARLVRIANRLTDSLLANYSAAVGGPTGA